eukprot:10615431-Ditylum_brightwellii.AAC.1
MHADEEDTPITNLSDIDSYDPTTETCSYATKLHHLTSSSCEGMHNFTSYPVLITGKDLRQALSSFFVSIASLALLASPRHNPKIRLDNPH